MGKTRKDGYRGKDYRREKKNKRKQWSAPEPQPVKYK